jgi:hypothetical protein
MKPNHGRQVCVAVALRPDQVRELNKRLPPLQRSFLIRQMIDDFLAGKISVSYSFTPPESRN